MKRTSRHRYLHISVFFLIYSIIQVVSDRYSGPNSDDTDKETDTSAHQHVLNMLHTHTSHSSTGKETTSTESDKAHSHVLGVLQAHAEHSSLGKEQVTAPSTAAHDHIINILHGHSGHGAIGNTAAPNATKSTEAFEMMVSKLVDHVHESIGAGGIKDLTWGANQNGYSLGQKGTLWSKDHHQVDGEYGASKAWNSHGLKPDSCRGELDYSHKPSGSTAFVAANRTPDYGTDGAAGLIYSIAQGKNYNVDLTSQYTRHYGGPGGTGKPEGQVLLTGEYRFP